MVYADVTLDGDMAVKYSLNRKNEVIRIEAVGESGEALAEEMIENGMKGKAIETAIEYAEKYIEEHSDDPEGETFTITVDCRDEAVKKEMEGSLNDKYGGSSENKPSGNKKNKSGAETGRDASDDKSGNDHAADDKKAGGKDKEPKKEKSDPGSGGADAGRDPAERSDGMSQP